MSRPRRAKRHPADSTPLTAAQAKLVADHADWARSGALKYADRWRRLITEDELVSACHLGLVNAARNFDPARGFKFKTYALYYCEAAMHRELNTRRRLDGCVFDAREKGGMRTVLQRIAWPEHENGRPMDLAILPATQVDEVDEVRRRELVLELCPRRALRFVRPTLEGLPLVEVARRTRCSEHVVRETLRRAIRTIRTRLTHRARAPRPITPQDAAA